MSIQALTYVLEHCEATGSARCLMFAIANHANERGENCWASVATLAHEARIAERTTQYALRDLEEAGEIEVSGISAKGTTVYRICAMAEKADQLPLLASRQRGADPAPGGANHDKGGCKSAPEGVQTSAPEPSLTVKGTTPLTPQRGEHRSGRRRDQDRAHAAMDAFAAEHFPEWDPAHVRVASAWAERRHGMRHGPPTIEQIRDELERMHAEPISEAA